MKTIELGPRSLEVLSGTLDETLRLIEQRF